MPVTGLPISTNGEPLSLADAKQYLGVDAGYTDEDTLIQGFITAAREYCEKFCNRTFVTSASRSMVFDRFPGWQHHHSHIFRLNYSPVLSVDSITYLDVNGQQQTLDPSVYVVDLNSIAPRIALASGQAWPQTINEINTVVVNYTAGYPDGVPQPIIAAMQLLIGLWYDHRSEGAAPGLTSIPFGVESLLWAYRVA